MGKKKEKTETAAKNVEKTETVDKNKVLKDLVAAGEEFSPEWLDMSSGELLALLDAVKARKAAFGEIKTLVSSKTLQIQQLMGIILHDDPSIFGNKTQSWAVSLGRLCCSPAFKTFLNSGKSLDDIKVFLETCKDK